MSYSLGSSFDTSKSSRGGASIPADSMATSASTPAPELNGTAGTGAVLQYPTSGLTASSTESTLNSSAGGRCNLPVVQHTHNTDSPPFDSIPIAARAPSVSNDISTGGSLVCAAGKYCRAPRGTSLYGPGGEAPTHSCFNCNGPIHCVMFCGHRFCDLSGSVHVSLLSPIGRSALRVGVVGVDPYESERVMCLKCISDIKELVTNLQPDGNGITADGQEADLSILTGGADPAPSGEYAIYNCSWEHVMVSAGESNLVMGKKHDPHNLTKLKGFLVGDRLIEISKISTDDLKKWVARTGGISRARKKKKKDLADAIVLYRAAKERQSMTGEHEVMVPGTNDVLVINSKRLILCGTH